MKRIMVLRLVCAVLWVLPWVAQGLTLGDGDRTGVTVAKNAMNQLRVVGDRIQTIRGIPAEVLVTLDPELGDAYLTVNTEKPFTAFITTEKNRRVVLDCLPLLDIPAKVIVIEAPMTVTSTSPSPVQTSDVLAFLQELRRDVKALAAKQKAFVNHESPKQRLPISMLLLQKQQGSLLGKVYWVRSQDAWQAHSNTQDNFVARIVLPVSRALHPAFYVVEVAYA